MALPIVFAQVMTLGQHETFRRCVERCGVDAYLKRFSWHNRWLAMAFARREGDTGALAELFYPDGLRRIHYVGAV